MFKLLKKVTVLISAVVLILTVFLIVPGCGNDQAKQDFVDEYLSILDELQSQPEIAEEGREAFIQYAKSGYTDLESAEGAMESYEKSMEKDQAGFDALENMNKPDSQAEEIVIKFQEGIEKITEGNSEYANSLAKAADQTIEERAGISQETTTLLAPTASGMESILSSLEKLIGYIDEYGLDGKEVAEEWHAKIKSEYEAINAILNQ